MPIYPHTPRRTPRLLARREEPLEAWWQRLAHPPRSRNRRPRNRGWTLPNRNT